MRWQFYRREALCVQWGLWCDDLVSHHVLKIESCQFFNDHVTIDITVWWLYTLTVVLDMVYYSKHPVILHMWAMACDGYIYLPIAWGKLSQEHSFHVIFTIFQYLTYFQFLFQSQNNMFLL
jgi:hypothetical protein